MIIAYRHPYGDTPFDVLVEYVQNLWDFANRLAGGAISGRRTVRPYRALLVPGMPIDLTARLARYRREKRVCVGETLADLQRSYTECISQARNQR